MEPHASGCAVHNAPALDPGPCDCGPVTDAGKVDDQADFRRNSALFAAAQAYGSLASKMSSDEFVRVARVFEAYLKNG